MSTYSLDVAQDRATWNRLDRFTRGYISAAMWTLTDDQGQSLDQLGLHDIAPETITIAVAECRIFTDANGEDLTATGEDDDEQHGHDFWLTRNRHGVGFWDRGYGEVGQRLTDAAHAEGEVEWYVGDDGQVYQG